MFDMPDRSEVGLLRFGIVFTMYHLISRIILEPILNRLNRPAGRLDRGIIISGKITMSLLKC